MSCDCDMMCPDGLVSMYQGETLTMTLIPRAEDELNDYNIKAVLVTDSARKAVILQWDDISVSENGTAVFEITGDQSRELEKGIYMLEVALKEKETGREMKSQIRRAVKVKTSYTK